MSRIHFVGGEKGGVGKSVMARLLAQYWIDRGTPWRGFDTDLSHGALVRYYSDFAEPIDIGRLEDLDRLVEQSVEGDEEVLVDMAAQTERGLHQWIDSGGVLELAEELGLDLVFWHVMDDGKDSVNLLSGVLDRYADRSRCVVVLNHGRGVDFTAFWESDTGRRLNDASVPIMELKGLHKPTMAKIDRLDKSFWAAANNTAGPSGDHLGLMERQRVKIWLKHAYTEFQRLGY